METHDEITSDEQAEGQRRQPGKFGRAAGCFFVVVALTATMLGLLLIRREQPKLVVSIEMSADSFGPTESIPVVVHMVNEDDKTVRIFDPSVNDMTLELIVVDETGHRYEKHVPYHRGMKPASPPREFKPGETCTVTEDLAVGYNLVPGKHYTVRAAYRTLNYPDETVWFGIVKSRPKHFSIRTQS